MRLLPKSIHRCRRYPTKFNSGRDIPLESANFQTRRTTKVKEYKSLSHTRWDCKYHVVFIPKYRRKKMYGAIRTHLGKILHELAKQKGVYADSCE